MFYSQKQTTITVGGCLVPYLHLYIPASLSEDAAKYSGLVFLCQLTSRVKIFSLNTPISQIVSAPPPQIVTAPPPQIFSL